MILALGADLTKTGYWSQGKRGMDLGEGQVVTGHNAWRGGSPLQFAQELCSVVGERMKENNLSNLVEFLTEEVRPAYKYGIYIYANP